MKYQTEWRQYLENNRRLSQRTIEEYAKDIAEFEAWMNQATTKVAPEHISCTILTMYVDTMGASHLKTSTIKRRVSALRSYFAFLQRTHARTDNPATSIETPRLTQKLVKPCKSDTITTYLNTPAITEADKMLHAITALMATTGMRISEALSIDTANVNPREMTIKIAGKGARERICYYNETARKHLNTYAKGKSGKIFAGWSDRDVRDLMQAAMKEDGRGIHPHQLRHYFGTELTNNGAELKTIATMMGHARITSTERYTHVAERRTRATYEKYQPRI